MLEAIHLSKRYDRRLALDDLSITVASGEVLCLLGANGAGKTTTINLFLNFVQPTSGQAKVNGIDVTVDPVGSKQHLAYIPEHVMLYRRMTGIENLEYFVGLMNGVRHSRRALLGLLGDAGLPQGAEHRRVESYSKGMRQKVGLAIAAAKDARAILLDEPTSGLDPKASNMFSESVEQMRQRGMAVLMATHDLYRAKESGDRLGIMRDGRLKTVIRSSEVSHTALEQLYLGYMQDDPKAAGE